uniref:Uncharacterized protein n=1 Tax=Entomoneis paludosa TaxID=265537 RepID=A0A7S2Y613_9STRA
MADESPRNVVSPTLSGGSQTSEIPHMGDLMSQSVQRISMDEVEHIGDVLSDSLQELEQDNSSGSDSSNKLASHGAILAAATTPNDTGEYQPQQDQDDGRATSAFPGVAMAATLGLGAVADLDAEQNVATRPEQNYGMDDYGTTRDGELEPGQKAEIPFGTEADAAEYYGYGDGVDLEKEESAEIAFGMDTGSENSFLFNMVDSNTGFVDNGAQMNGSENDLLYNLEDPEDDSEEEKQETGYEAETRYEKDRAIPFETLGSHHEGPYLEDFMSSDGYSKSTSFATPSTPSSEDDEYAYEVERLAHAYEQQSARDVDYVRSVESPLSRAATKADREMTEREHSKMMRRMARKQARELEEQQWEAEMLRIFWYSLFTISIIIVVGAIVVSASNQGIKR